MSKPKAVTFTLPSGAKVTSPERVARKLGWKPPAPRRKKQDTQEG